eukprot:m.402914 g.402914  ORF g.402914 m.402914 type:complete len:368 (-) comp56456_c0_seq2:39-1142(-)
MSRKYVDQSAPRSKWYFQCDKIDVQDSITLLGLIQRRQKSMATATIADWLEKGYIKVNGAAPVGLDQLLAQNDRIFIEIPPPPLAFDPMSIEINMLFQDDAIMCINKQAGILVQPNSDFQLENLMSALHARLRNHEDRSKDRVPFLAHRLDRCTSGALLLALNQHATRILGRQFERRQVSKVYLALVFGTLTRPQGTIDAPIREDGPKMLCVGPGGKPASTDYEIVEQFAQAALVRFKPKTGRTHQIRLHATHIGHPLLCDPLYQLDATRGQRAVPAEILNRCALHSSQISFLHPVLKTPTTFEAPLPADMEAAIAFLRSQSSRLDSLERQVENEDHDALEHEVASDEAAEPSDFAQPAQSPGAVLE